MNEQGVDIESNLLTESLTDIEQISSKNNLCGAIKKELRTRKIKENSHNDFWYEQLTLAQKISANELYQYGYFLQFIRGKAHKSVAVFACDDKVAVIDHEGEISLNPNINLRRK